MNALVMSLSNLLLWNFDIDQYLNRIVPAPRWDRVPVPIARFLGHRPAKPSELGNIVIILWAAIGIFCSITLIELVSRSIPVIEQSGLLIVASFGAAAVLEFYAIESPLAQPRNAILGQVISATIGVSVSKLFALSPHNESIRWLGGGLSCALATVAMALTKAVHPPAGATALLAVVDEVAVSLGWLLIPIILLGGVIMLGTALLVNNIQRRFPSYWWTPEDLTQPRPGVVRETKDLEHGQASISEDQGDTSTLNEILITNGRVVVPPHIYLTQEERFILETIGSRL